MRILITGGFGFVGGRLAQHLQQIGHQIILGSRQVNSSPNWLPEAEVVTTLWNDSLSLQNICRHVDVVIHAAGMNAKDCSLDPVAALEINGLATARLIDAASSAGVRRLMYLSTAHVYKSPLVGRISEDTCPQNFHPYATSHLAGENALLSASRLGTIEGVVLRLSNVFGACTHKDVNCWTLLVNDLCRQAVMERRLTLRSSGMQRRDFVDMNTTCLAITHLLELSKHPLVNEIYNVGGAWAPRVIDMAKLIQTRCQVVLGYQPVLDCAEDDGADVTQELDFRIDKLVASGFPVSANVTEEIDALLILCKEFFGPK